MRPRALAVVGLGVISRFYLAAVEESPAFRLAAVCDLDPHSLDPWQGRVPCYRDHRELLAGERLDAVVVTVPNDVHAAVCRDSLAAGVAVCVEKPLATTLADADALAALAASGGVPLLTAFHRRYNQRVAELARRVTGGPPVVSVTVRYFERIEEHVGRDRWYLDPARCGGGCLADNGPNAFDLVRLFLGEVAVTGARIERDAGGLDRRASVALAGGGGARARVELDWSYDGELKDVEVELADGTVHRADMLDGYPGFKQSLWHEYAGILADFAGLLERPEGRRDGGLAALRLVEAGYRAEGAALVTP
ncbi:Gfo/Idh/MocA family protein [Streptacidiphilus sp. P02-A3a]|uniref:Gfo/Idh/MocA family protein n=1 Tax=Streptacidiphilus sp. P02-A3a TaxID=2704468 RepID=UPI0015F9B511|nr:Gfo/Idh/MocA family oxidoreductase [Streptacidiphilus sp. P02-A3a]QMU71333.1 Gfo/Idh/MocA family oxidoreductase [Streptacidiphilus sp. P02-A3a]